MSSANVPANPTPEELKQAASSSVSATTTTTTTSGSWSKLPSSLKGIFHSSTSPEQETSETSQTPTSNTGKEAFFSKLKQQVSDIDVHALLPDGTKVRDYWKDLETKFQNDFTRDAISKEQVEVGKNLRAKGLRAKHPVVIIPGFTSSGLESWCFEDCGDEHCRSRIWGTMSMVRTLVREPKRWLAHMVLDEETGLDPPNIKIRASQGLEAADYFVGGYWIWAKLIEQLGCIGYDNGSIHLASYDWRLAMDDLEKRDGYFSRLKAQIEVLNQTLKEKVVVIAHSMGALVFLYFVQWVTAKDQHWGKQNLHAFVNVAGPLLGAPKCLAALLSGEMRDTVQNPLGADALDKFFSREERAHIFRTWGSLAAMLPKGGAAVWGDPELGAPDKQGDGGIIRLKDETRLSMDEALELLRAMAGPKWTQRIDGIYSFGLDTSSGPGKEQRKWVNPLESPLPDLGEARIYNFYGIGRSTERAYAYDATAQGRVGKIMTEIMEKALKFEKGVLNGDGDATVPTISLGFMGTVAWKQKRWNPHGVAVCTKEYQDDETTKERGIKSGDHVDILGNLELLEDFLTIAAGQTVKDRITSTVVECGQEVLHRIETHSVTSAATIKARIKDKVLAKLDKFLK